jgi:hypothetical protein
MPPFSYNYGESSEFCSNWPRKVERICRIYSCSEGGNAHRWDILIKLVLAQQFLYKIHTMNCMKIHQMVSSLMCWVTTNRWTWSLYESFFLFCKEFLTIFWSAESCVICLKWLRYIARKTGKLVEAVMTHFIQFICCLPYKNLYKESYLCVWGLKSLFGFVKKKKKIVISPLI